MLPELGFIALLIAAVLAVLQCVLPWTGLLLKQGGLAAVARPLACCAFVLFFAALICLAVSLAQDDFSVVYIAQHSNSRLPLFFKVAAAWGGHEGSMLFFVVTLSLWSALVAVFTRRESSTVPLHVLAILGGITAAFALFAIFTSNPFERLFPPPFEGRDLNPMLQDAALIFHPPLLYIGYAGFAVSFAYAMAALLVGKFDSNMAHASRAWALAAWVFLTAGIALGAWWAYYELGWGGWWFWDPVENASLMPWLLGTALLHVLAVNERRGAFGIAVLLLSIFTFSFSLLGTFIVRSGILSSVHAFANDPGRGLALLLILTVLLIVVLGLFALRANLRPSPAQFNLVSRESALAATAALLCVATACVMIGTFYPLVYNLLGLGALSVGAPYFNTVFVPLCLLLLLLLPLAPVLRWQAMPAGWALRQLPWLAIGGLAGTWLCLRHSLPVSFFALAACVLAGWGVVAILVAIARDGNSRRLGIYLAHIGVGVAVIGAAQLGQYTEERWLSMTRDTPHTLAGYTFTLTGSEPLIGPNYTAEQLAVRVDRSGAAIATLHPEQRHYTVRAQTMREPGVATVLSGDLYATVGEKLGPESYTMHLQYKPMAAWLWLGAILMAGGGLLRLVALRRQAPPSSEA